MLLHLWHVLEHLPDLESHSFNLFKHFVKT